MTRKLFFIIFCFLFSANAIASEVYNNKTSIPDVDGDKKQEVCIYTLKAKQGGYLGTLIIKSNQNILWKDQWFISKRDFSNLITMEREQSRLKTTSASAWVKNIFKAHYGVTVNFTPVSQTDIQDEQIVFASGKNKISIKKIMQEILLNYDPVVISYRAQWEEDLIQIVYLNSIKQFICFKRGID